MKIAQVAPLHESVPPQLYGGTERVVCYLTEELVQQGHEVTLFASGDSRTSARLEPVVPRSLRLDAAAPDPLAHHVRMLGVLARQWQRFDVVHFHCDYLHFPLSRALGLRQLTTLHGRQDLPDLDPLYREFSEMPLVSISDYQRRPLSDANWQGTVYHGLPEELYRFSPEPSDYLAFLGRVSPEKRIDRAVEIAIRARLPLKIAAKVDRADQSYFRREIEPLLAHPLVEFIGEIDDADKQRLLAGARALLFPIDWPEPFGMVMIEALACGTPVIAWPHGSVPEVLDHGRSGFLVESVEQAVAAVARLGELSRAQCRRLFEQRFSARRMGQDYVRLYQALSQVPAPRWAAH